MKTTGNALRLALAGTLASAVVLGGCGTADQPRQSAGSLTFMSGGGAYLDALDEAFLKPFAKDTGIAVHNDPTLSYAKIKTMVGAGKVTIDVTPAEGYWEIQECGKTLLPLDRTLVDLSDIDPALIQGECGAPLLTYSTAIYYNKEAYPGPDKPVGCRDFFDTAKFPGKRAVRDSAVPNPLIECALVADGVSPDALYPLDLDRAFKKIATIRKDLVFWASGAESTQLMTAGEVAMIHAWNGRAYAAIAEQGAGFAPAYGEAFLIYDTLVVPKGVRDPKAAMKLVDYMLDPARQAKLTSLIPYSPSNKKAVLTGLPAPLQEFLPETNPKVAEGVHVQDQRWWAQNADEVTRRWQAMFQG
ncbi:ABC transporter substrate-binding protein [Thermoactinospora rubra]|uniref:ABC transporter substrate-binding protein n=1 Tax=Thermoactinospora rubra TaxID=1088767 RepID=UPI000A11DFD1|nr:ABC transporter substrate-binding protein [Thermoactinospora rubra]